MNRILGSTWGASVLCALLGALVVAFIGVVVGAGPAVTIFAAVLFGALLTFVVQVGVVITILWQARGTGNDLGATMVQEAETPTGQVELKRMNFATLLTVAMVQELHLSLFLRDEPLWVWAFLGMGEDAIIPRDYGQWNRYIEWALMVGLFIFAVVGAILIAVFVNSITLNLACALPAFLFGAALLFFIGIFLVSVIRRVLILYTLRSDEDKII